MEKPLIVYSNVPTFKEWPTKFKLLFQALDNIVVAVGQVPDDIPTDTAGVTTLSSRGRGYGRAAG